MSRSSLAVRISAFAHQRGPVKGPPDRFEPKFSTLAATASRNGGGSFLEIMSSKVLKVAVGAHTAGICADMSVDGPRIGTLVAIIDRAKNLPNRKSMGKQNPYCAARLGKEAKKTDTDMRGGQTPKW